MKKLERSLSLKSAIAISISAMLGSGIFVLPGLAMSLTGPSIWLAYIVASLCVLPAALSKAELATAMPTSGGTYVYVERAFGPLAGTIAGFGLWLSLMLKSAFSLVGLSAYLLVLADLPLKPTALCLLALVVVLNIAGVRKVGHAQMAIMLVVLISLLVIVIPGVAQTHSTQYHPFFTHGGHGFLAAVAFVFVSYTGVTEISAIAEEVKDPDKTLPIAILLSLFIVTCLYGIVTFTLVGVLPSHELAGTPTTQADLHPIYSLAQAVGGTTLGYCAAILGVITLTSMASTGVLASSRFPFAMTRDQLLPSFFGYVHPHFLTPIWCILFTGGAIACAILTLDIFHIAKLASAFKVLMFIFDNASTIVFRETGVQWYAPRYRSMMYPWIQIFGIISGLVLIFMLGFDGLFAILVVFGLGTVLYFAFGHGTVHRKSVLKLYGRRAFTLLFSGRSSTTRPTPAGNGNQQPLSRPLRYTPLRMEAAVVVPLFGKERSPETLGEIGAALANGRKVEVVHITELPYQTNLDAMLEEDLYVQSLNRRINAMAKHKKVNIDFDAVVTHDLIESVHGISRRLQCEWMVMGWQGRSAGSLLVRNPIGWLVSQLSCNSAVFKDAGVRYIRRILVYAGSDDNGHLVAETGNHLATIYNADLCFTRVITPNMNKTECSKRENFLEQVCQRSKVSAETLLIEAPDSITGIVQASAAYDLLVFGASREHHFLDIMFGIGKDKLTEQAACSVLRLAVPYPSQNKPDK